MNNLIPIDLSISLLAWDTTAFSMHTPCKPVEAQRLAPFSVKKRVEGVQGVKNEKPLFFSGKKPIRA
ncbi:MAG: hypothetical protein ACI4PY_00270 [Akkermansia muciniphila]